MLHQQLIRLRRPNVLLGFQFFVLSVPYKASVVLSLLVAGWGTTIASRQAEPKVTAASLLVRQMDVDKRLLILSVNGGCQQQIFSNQVLHHKRIHLISTIVFYNW